jgi:hypothetical protein
MSEPSPAGFFTLGVPKDRYDLPHRPLGVPVILLIRKVICRALGLLRESGFNLAEATEDQVTAALRSTIENDLRQTGAIPGFNRRNYDPVFRQSQVANFDGTRLTKTPDLIFKLRIAEKIAYSGLSEFDALFVECKPVDATHAAGSRYCDDGLVRFVLGDYAWAMPEGMMVGYVRDQRTITGHLLPVMNETGRMVSLATQQLPQVLAAHKAESFGVDRIHVSIHRRDFAWPNEKGPATNITLYHLWHDCS